MAAPSPASTTRRAPPAPVRWAYLVLAVISLVAGVIGLLLPLVPTVPFILLAAWAAARGSPRLLNWLETHPHFGPTLTDWRRGRVVRRRAKWLAAAAMAGSCGSMLFILGPRWYVLCVIAALATVLTWLWQRPEALPAEEPPQP